MNIIDAHNAALPRQQIDSTYFVYGTPVLLRCNSKAIRCLADSSFAAWNVLQRADLGGQPNVELALLGLEAGSVPSTPPHYHVTPQTVSVTQGALTLHASRPKCNGYLQVPLGYCAQRASAFRRLYLDCAVLFLATHHDRVPLHASAVLIDKRPVLIFGPSGSGKSTLLYALMRRGCPVLAEESLCVSRLGGVALWGLAQEVGLRAGALALFPELSGCLPQQQPNGREKHLVPVPSAQRAYPKQHGPFTLAFLEPADSATAILPLSAEDARARLLAGREPGFDLASDYEEAVDALLAESRCVRLPRAATPEATVDALFAQ